MVSSSLPLAFILNYLCIKILTYVRMISFDAELWPLYSDLFSLCLEFSFLLSSSLLLCDMYYILFSSRIKIVMMQLVLVCIMLMVLHKKYILMLLYYNNPCVILLSQIIILQHLKKSFINRSLGWISLSMPLSLVCCVEGMHWWKEFRD